MSGSGLCWLGVAAPALQLPELVLLHQHRPSQAGDRGIDGEDAHEAGSALFSLFTRSNRKACYLRSEILRDDTMR